MKMTTLVFTSLMMAMVAFAQEPADIQEALNDPKVQQAMKDMAAKIKAACKNEKVPECDPKDTEKLSACMANSFSKLSPGCKAALAPGK